MNSRLMKSLPSELRMPLWKITNAGPKAVAATRFKEESLLEEHLEDWIAADPTILGEPLLVIGRQVLIPDTKGPFGPSRG
jgi:hypothetical protein